jgi:uncharacterized protein YndB with AHSA1/START domain
MSSDRIERETTIAAPVERVWEILTTAEHLGRWFGDAGAEVDLRPGGVMALHWREHGTVRARVERVEPHRLFSYRWAASMEAEPAEGHSTLVEFALEPAEDGGATLLRVVESGFAELRMSADERAEKVDGNARGWSQKMTDIAAYAGGRSVESAARA